MVRVERRKTGTVRETIEHVYCRDCKHCTVMNENVSFKTGKPIFGRCDYSAVWHLLSAPVLPRCKKFEKK